MRDYAYWLIFCSILVITYYLQSKVFLHPDIIYLLNLSNRMMAGGKYAQDFFETNPPMILYLYMPAVWLAKQTSMSLVLIFRIYILSFITFTTFLLNYLCKKIFLNDVLLRRIILATLLYGICFLPAYEFGQREHLLLIFLLPYLTLSILRLLDTRIPNFIAFVIGICAGLVFGLKPFFIPTFIIIEAFLVYKKSYRMLFRSEMLVILIVLVAYSLIVYWFDPNYYFEVAPIVSHLYLVGMRQPLSEVISNVPLLYCLTAILCGALFFKQSQHSNFLIILLLATIGLTIAVLIPRTMFMYQYLPAFALSLIIFCLLAVEIVRQWIPLLEMKISINHLSYAMILGLIFTTVWTVPLSFSTNLFRLSIQSVRDQHTKAFLNFITNQHPYMTYTFFSVDDDALIADLYPELHGSYVGSFSAFWWENGLLELKKIKTSASDIAQLANDENKLINIIVNDLKKNPRFVLVDTKEPNKYNFIAQFSTNSNFKREWANYQNLGQLGRFYIYQRKQ